jgi:molybdopterin-guanine dinucleotide biosynthesis protein A
MKTAGIVLCGGRSSRMGRPKAWLPFGGELMLQRVVKVVGEAADRGPIVVVAAPGQDVPPLPDGAALVRDEVEGRGPLGGLAAGLTALEGTADVVYLSSCDVPLLKPEFVRRVIGLLKRPPPPAPLPKGKGESDRPGSFSPFPLGRGAGGVGLRSAAPLVAVPRVNDRLHPLAAAYHVEVLPVVRAMLAAGRLRMMDLFDAVPTRVIEPEELVDIDAEFRSLCNLNTPDEYEAALRALDLPPRGAHEERA